MSPVRSDLEDFAPIVDATRRGAHRARPSVVSEVLPALSVVLVIAVVTAVVLIVLGGGGSDSKGNDNAAASPAVTPSVVATTAPPPSDQASTEPTKSQEPETTTEAPDAGDVDKGIAFAVLNDTNTSGLAKKAAAKLKGEGWTATPTTGNTSPKGRYDESVVFFKSDDDEAAAKQIAADLGISEVSKSATKSKSAPVTVILGKDFDS